MGIVLTEFKGEYPGVANADLPPNAASYAMNCYFEGHSVGGMNYAHTSAITVEQQPKYVPVRLHNKWMHAPSPYFAVQSPLVDDTVDRVYFVDPADNLLKQVNAKDVSVIDPEVIPASLISGTGVSPPTAKMVVTRKQPMKAAIPAGTKQKAQGDKFTMEVALAFAASRDGKWWSSKLYTGKTTGYTNSIIDIDFNDKLDDDFTQIKNDNNTYKGGYTNFRVLLMVKRAGGWVVIKTFTSLKSLESVGSAAYNASAVIDTTYNASNVLAFTVKGVATPVIAPKTPDKLSTQLAPEDGAGEVPDEKIPDGEVAKQRVYVYTKCRSLGKSVFEESSPSKPVTVDNFYSNSSAIIEFAEAPSDGYFYNVYRTNDSGQYLFVGSTNSLPVYNVDDERGVTYKDYTLTFTGTWTVGEVGYFNDPDVISNRYRKVKITRVSLPDVITTEVVTDATRLAKIHDEITTRTDTTTVNGLSVERTTKTELIDESYNGEEKIDYEFVYGETEWFEGSYASYFEDGTLVHSGRKAVITSSHKLVSATLRKTVSSKSYTTGAVGTVLEHTLTHPGCYNPRMIAANGDIKSETTGTVKGKFANAKIVEGGASCSSDGTTGYHDKKADNALGEEIPSVGWLPPPKLDGVALMHAGFLLGWRNDAIYCSELYLPHAWRPDTSYKLRYKFRRVIATANGAIALTDGSNYFISGDSPENLNLYEMPVAHPCIALDTIAVYGNDIIYLTVNGIAVVNQSGSKELMEGVISDYLFDTMAAKRTAYTVGNFYVLSSYTSNANGVVNTVSTLMVDLRSQTITKTDRLPMRATFDQGSGNVKISWNDTATGAVLGTIKAKGHIDTFKWWSKTFTLTKATSFGFLQVIASVYPIKIVVVGSINGKAQDNVNITLRDKRPVRFPANAYDSVAVRVNVVGVDKARVHKVILTSNREELYHE
jgi:hypothetical protein